MTDSKSVHSMARSTHLSVELQPATF